MIETRKLKIWTLVFHACILIGAGHGLLMMGLVGVVWFLELIKAVFNLSFSESTNWLSFGGIFSLAGQYFLIYSIYIKINKRKKIAQIVGIILLWSGILCFVYLTKEDISFVTFTAVPFFICTVITFLGRSIKKLYHYILDI